MCIESQKLKEAFKIFTDRPTYVIDEAAYATEVERMKGLLREVVDGEIEKLTKVELLRLFSMCGALRPVEPHYLVHSAAIAYGRVTLAEIAKNNEELRKAYEQV